MSTRISNVDEALDKYFDGNTDKLDKESIKQLFQSKKITAKVGNQLMKFMKSSTEEPSPEPVKESPKIVIPTHLIDCDITKIQNELTSKKEDVKRLNKLLRECKSKEYTYGNLTLEGLIKVIKKENKNTVHEFLDLFPRVAETTAISKKLDDRNHVFEALWILAYYFNLDIVGEDKQKVNRVFYKNLEKGGDKINKTTFLSNKVNDGSGSGIVDIYYSHENKNSPNTKYLEGKKYNWKDPPSCVDAKPREIFDTFLCSAKFFKKEKSGDKYDVAQIVIEADEVFNNSGKGKPFEYNIVLLVKDKEELKSKLNRTDKTYAKRIHKIYDLTDLNDFYNQMKNLDLPQLQLKNTKENRLISRFHQKYFIDYTKLCIENGDKKFAWGAVPRSGKSYMIGGLISELKPKYVFLILGAITETKNQFIDELFLKEKQGFSDFDEYCVHDLQNKIIYRKENSKHIFVCSQEMMKMKTTGKEGDILPPEIKKILKEEKDKIIFFDEIHQGSGNQSQQGEMLKKLVFNNEYKAFVMVTATFAKPYLRYMNEGTSNTNLIQWRYEDIQNMKNIGDFSIDEITGEKVYHVLNDFLDNINQENDGGRKVTIFTDVVNQYKSTGKTMEHLAEEYTKYPELFVSTPFIEDIPPEYSSIINNGEINIEEIFKPLTKLNSDENRINNSSKCISYLEYLQTEIYEKYIYNTLNYDIIYPHSEIWFLPTTLRGMKNDVYNDKIGKEVKDKKNSPFRNLAKNLTILMMRNEYFRKNYCIAIMHGLGFDETPIEMINENMEHGGHSIQWNEAKVQNTCKIMKDKGNEICITTICPKHKNEDSIKDCLLKQEAYAKMNNKSLLILTGQMMRLGVSLPCVDIALHMDPIKSVDTIYQSMFRVLTERPGKDKGIFVDILTQRNINFVYDMVDYNMDKATPTLSGKKKEIYNKLIFYNYNGISLLKNDKYQDIYNKLTKRFDLDNDDNFLKRLNKGVNITKDVGDIFKNSPELTLYIDTFYELMNELNINYSEKGEKIIENLEKRGENKSGDQEDKEDGEQQENKVVDKSGDSKKEKKNKYDQIQRFIEDIIFLFVISDNYEKLNENEIKRNKDKYCQKIIEFLNSDIHDIINKCKNEIYEDNEIINCHLLNIIKANKQDVIDKIILLKSRLIEMFTLICEGSGEGFINIYINYIDNMKKIKQNTSKMSKIPPCSKEFKKSENKLGLKGVPVGVMNEIRKRLTVREEEKNLYGEVFTPIELICEMFSHIPDDVWKNPDLKWLDPANGIGNFPVVAYYKLMDSLKDKYDPKKYPGEKLTLSQHIINRMLYMVELNPVNVRVCKKIFKMIDPKATPNIVKHDFLTFKRFRGIDKFDVIMGNPPWNDNKVGKQGGSRAKNSLWDKFIFKSFEILNDNGYFMFINPAQWRGLGPEYHKIWDLITPLNIIYLHIYGEERGKQMFNVGSRFDVYVLHNKKSDKSTHIIDELGIKNNIKISDFPFLPNHSYEKFKDIITSEEKGIDVIHDYFYANTSKIVSYKSNKTFKHEVFHGIPSGGPTYIYTNDKNKGHFGIPKFILSAGRHQYSHPEQNDYEGNYGMSQMCFGIPIKSKKEGNYILNAINTEDFKEIIKATKWGAFQTQWEMFKYFKPDFYKHLLDKHSSKDPEILASKKEESAEKVSLSEEPVVPAKKSKCSKAHPEAPCSGDKPREKNGCCYKDSKQSPKPKQTKNKSKNRGGSKHTGGGRKHRFRKTNRKFKTNRKKHRKNKSKRRTRKKR